MTDAAGEPVPLADEVVGDKDCQSRAVVLDLTTNGFRTYISERDCGPQFWRQQKPARDAVYGNRRRIRGERGKGLLRRRGEFLERTFAHACRCPSRAGRHLMATIGW